jgi:PKD repeat protein
MSETRRSLLGIIVIAALSAACTLQKAEAPPLTGPSSLALSLSAAASPDILVENGQHQSTIRIIARDQFGQPMPNVSLRVDTVVGNAIVDIGTLSARNVTTNASGEATVIYTAPMARFRGVDSGTIVTIAVRPVGTDYFGTSVGTITSIRLVPEAVVFDPGAPIPSFFFAPSNPKAGDSVFFDASSSSDPGGAIVLYHWNYGDGTVENDRTQPTETHDFVAPGTYFVTLTVTDNEGKNSSLTKAVTVSGS